MRTGQERSHQRCSFCQHCTLNEKEKRKTLQMRKKILPEKVSTHLNQRLSTIVTFENYSVSLFPSFLSVIPLTLLFFLSLFVFLFSLLISRFLELKEKFAIKGRNYIKDVNWTLRKRKSNSLGHLRHFISLDKFKNAQ